MELERIETLPDPKPQLTAQEREHLLSLPNGAKELALAEDLNVMRQNQRWTMERVQRINNFVAGYSKDFDFWRTVRIVIASVLGSAAGILALYRLLHL